MTIPLLSATNLSYHGQDRPLLDRVSFALKAGQKVALIGRSGSGKSLLLQALADLLPLTDDNLSNIYFHNLPICQIPPAEYRAKVALFHQTPNLMTGTTVLDNLTLPFSFKHYAHQTLDKDWLLDKLNQFGKHSNFLTQSVDTLSGGERQIVAFLQTLQLNPTVALFDETTSALDDETTNHLIRLVLDWHNKDKALIWVTHTPSEQDKLGAKLWQMTNGQLNTGETDDHCA